MNNNIQTRKRKHPSRRQYFRQLRSTSQKRLIQTLLWIMLLFLLTCVSSLEQFLTHQTLSFTFNRNPNFLEFFNIDFRITHQKWIIIKLGHFTGFAILYFLLWKWNRKPGISLIAATILAILTEVLQLYFSRDGRLLDIGIDFAGIMLSFLVIKNFHNAKSNSREKSPSHSS
ncbi:VanZ family protein [Ammoniphilus sp. YIM 78166]|uniref:VanZ family protein n=1 Tax=Ammoniphilus sp. YIM 78166 TaxID=1644106 RepID=UPI00106FCF97|nr:VanZ family protein [Ammoniphilus sp. YIM 78166]